MGELLNRRIVISILLSLALGIAILVGNGSLSSQGMKAGDPKIALSNQNIEKSGVASGDLIGVVLKNSTRSDRIYQLRISYSQFNSRKIRCAVPALSKKIFYVSLKGALSMNTVEMQIDNYPEIIKLTIV
jgi:hypothetical protein